MAVPKRRTSRSKRNMRRANHDKVAAPNIVPCPNCGEPVGPAPRLRVLRPLQGPRGEDAGRRRPSKQRPDDGRGGSFHLASLPGYFSVTSERGATARDYTAQLCHAHRPAPLAHPRHRAYLPPVVRTNLDLEKMVETSDAWITERTGIKERRIAPDGVVTSDMATAAARGRPRDGGPEGDRPRHDHRGHGHPRHADAGHGGLRAAEARRRRLPGVRPERGLRGVRLRPVDRRPVHRDRPDAARARRRASSSCRASSTGPTARRASSSATARAPSSSAPPTPAGRREAARACCRRPSSPTARSRTRCRSPAAAASTPTSHGRSTTRLQYMHMKGQDIFKVAVKNLLSASQQRPRRAPGMTQDDIDWICPHQANLRIIDQVVAARRRAAREGAHEHRPRRQHVERVDPHPARRELPRRARSRPATPSSCAPSAPGISWGSAIVRL